MQHRIALIIPCFNEESSISSVIHEIISLKLPSDYSLHPIVINDCSNDNTASVASQLPCTLLDLPVNLGIGGAVQTGFKYAFENDFDIAVQLDGDGQHPPGELLNLIAPIIINEADIVIGSRFITKKGFQSSALRRTGIKYFKNLNRFLLGITITDSTSGFRALNKKAISIVCNYYPDEYPEPEAIILYKLNGLKMTEIPVVMRERMGGTSSIRSFGSIYYMLKVTLGILFIYLRLKLNGKRNSFQDSNN